jgi:hypothetical protein
VPTCIGNFGPKRKQKKRWKIPGDRRDARALALGRCFCYFIYARCAAPRKCARLVQIQDQGALCELPIEDYSIFALQPLPSLSAHHHYHTIFHLQCRYLGDGRKRGLTRTRKKGRVPCLCWVCRCALSLFAICKMVDACMRWRHVQSPLLCCSAARHATRN